MATKLDKYLQLKKKVESAQQRADQAKGALGEIMKQLKRDFSCGILAEAKKKLKQLEKAEALFKKEFDDAVEKYEEDWEGDIDNG